MRTIQAIGKVTCPKSRPATPLEVWIEVFQPDEVSLHDYLLIDSMRQQVLAMVAAIEAVESQSPYIAELAVLLHG